MKRRTNRFLLAGHSFDVSVDKGSERDQLDYIAQFTPDTACAPACGDVSRVRWHRSRKLFDDYSVRLAAAPSLHVTPFRGEPYRFTRLQHASWWRPDPLSGITQDHLYARDARRRLHVLVHPEAERGERYVMRIIRETVLRCGENRGWAAFHAAAAAASAGGLLIAGPSGAGKTTMLAALLAHGQAHLVASDRAMVTEDASMVVGAPLSVRVAAGTLSASPVSSRLPSPAGLTRVFGTAVKASFTPQTFASAFGGEVQECVPLRAVVLPHLSGGDDPPRVRCMRPQEARAELAMACCTPYDEDWLQPWFAERVKETEALSVQSAGLIDSMVAQGPVLRLSAGVKAPELLPRLADAVGRWTA